MTKRVRVLTIIDSLGVGGAQALLPTFLRHLNQSRFETHVLALAETPENHIQCEIVAAGGSLTQWPGRRLVNLGQVREIARMIEAYDVDIVHSHLLYSNVHGSLAARLARRPVVATLHNVHGLNPLLKRKLEASVLRLTRARALAVSEGVRSSYQFRLGLNADQMVVVPNAIDLTRFNDLCPDVVARTRRDALHGADGPLVVAVGRMVPTKGFADLVRASATLHETFPGARVIVAGREADGTREVKAEIERLGLGGVVRLLGQRSDVAELLAAADIFVSPSRSEGAPVTHLEAMAAGVPIVATCVGGVPEIIEDGANGLLVQAGRAEQLAEALVRLSSDRDLARRFSTRGREIVREYGADTWTRKIEREYESVLAGQSGAAVRQVAR